jgi:hypothetical protein
MYMIRCVAGQAPRPFRRNGTAIQGDAYVAISCTVRIPVADSVYYRYEEDINGYGPRQMDLDRDTCMQMQCISSFNRSDN